MRLVTRDLTSNDRNDRVGTEVQDPDTTDDSKQVMDEKRELFEYGFGTPFSYWKKYTYYEYIGPKYSDLKDELLNNEVYKLKLNEYNQIVVKAETCHVKIQNIMGQGEDKNTPYAKYNEHLNEMLEIPKDTLISKKHLCSILFYTDFTNLPRSMKNVCRRMNNVETIEDVKKRHQELTNWLRLLMETILLYGNTYSHKDPPVYHGLNRKFYFREFKAKFYIPTSTTTDRNIAINFAEGSQGIILEFGGLETIGDPYFVCFMYHIFRLN